MVDCYYYIFFFFSSRRRHTRCSRDWSSDVCSSDLIAAQESGMRPLVEDGLEKTKAGITTIEELGRILEVSEYAAASCPGCGRHLNSEYRFCPYCRAELRLVCAGCGRVLLSGWLACANCGQEYGRGSESI